MSSEIFYDKAFIRVEEKYIPVVNHGSSNCFEFDSRGRECCLPLMRYEKSLISMRGST